MFADRAEAGAKLLSRLDQPSFAAEVVLALPRGGVPVAAVIAEGLRLPLDLIIVRKIGAPGQSELAVGAVSNGHDMEVVINRNVARIFALSDEDINKLAQAELAEIKRRRSLYCADRKPIPLMGKTAIIVDDGAATGASMRSAIHIVRQQGAKKVIVAIPVAPRDVFRMLSSEADAAICLEMPDPFISVGSHYSEFNQVDDQEVIATMARLPH